MISNEVFAAIELLDLDPIKLKLMHPTHGEGWSQARADAIATEYRRFLYLQHAYRSEKTSPAADVDTFWHYHILDTMKYAADCERAFGYFMHHYPYLGLLADDPADIALQAAERTRTLYEATFGQAYRPAFEQEARHGVEALPPHGRCQLCMSVRPPAHAC